MKSLKKIIKKNLKLYKYILAIYKVYIAIKDIKISLHSIKELKWELTDSVGLGENNYIFYNNFFSYILNNSELLFIDVGANDGWFAKVIFRFMPNATVVSFEPLKSMIPYLENLQNKRKNYKFENIGLGANNGSAVIHEFKTTGLSSLKNLNYEYDNINFNQEIKNEYQIEITTLDSYISKNGISDLICLKIDTQGFEMEVLQGAKSLFEKKQIKIIIIELMTIEKYQGTHLYLDIINYLNNFGFKLIDIHTSYYEKNGRLSEFDSIFILE